MSFRDEKAALLARADSLDRELESTKQRLATAEGDRERLRDQVKELQAERDRLRDRVGKQAARSGGVDPASRKKLIVAGATASVAIAAGAVLAITSSSSSDSPRATAVETTKASRPASPDPSPSLVSKAKARAKAKAEAEPEPEPADKLLEATAAFEYLDHVAFVLGERLSAPPQRPRSSRGFRQPTWFKAIERKRAIEQLARVARQPPPMSELDDSLTAYAEHYQSIVPLLDETSRYYSHEDYKDDDGKRGRELTAELAPRFEKLMTRSKEVGPALRARLASELARAPVGDGDTRGLVELAWRECSAIIYQLRAGQEPTAIDACSKAQAELASYVRDNELRRLEYLTSLLDKLVIYGKRAQRADKPYRRLSALARMAQIQAYAARKLASRRD